MKDLFRRQFLITPEPCHQALFSEWIHSRVGRFYLYVHPLMGMVSGTNGRQQLFLLGFAYHCHHPGWRKEEILNDLLQSEDEGDFHERFDKLSGNFVLMGYDDTEIIIYHDPASCSKVFYKRHKDFAIAGSDPKILQLAGNLKFDESTDALAYYNSEFFKKHRKWVGNLTWYKDVYQLLPNHRLHLSRQESVRYFPQEKLKNAGLEEGIETCSGLLSNLVAACSAQREVYVSLTAGWDSRVVASATRSVASKAGYYTFKKTKHSEKDKDIQIPAALCRDLGLSFNLFEVNDQFSASDQDQFFGSYELVSHQNMKMINQVFQHFPENAHVLLGVVSEIGKNYFEGVRVNNGKELRKTLHFPNLNYTNQYFEHWYKASYQKIKDLHYQPLDIAHWEQDITNFAGQIVFRLNYAAAVYSVFNCRHLIKSILKVPPRYRDKHGSRLYEGIIRQNWPALMRYPVNPFLRDRTIRAAKKFGIYRPYRQMMVKFGK